MPGRAAGRRRSWARNPSNGIMTGPRWLTDLLSEHEILTFAEVLADRDEGFIELAYQETGEEGRPLAEATKRFFEKVAAVAKRPILYQAVAGKPANTSPTRKAST